MSYVKFVWKPNLQMKNCILIGRTDRCVVDDIALISCYAPPSLEITEFLEMLDEIEELMLKANNKNIIVAGDFNARSPLWVLGKHNRKGTLLEEWTSQMDLRLANEGYTTA